jgi:hypothetical protein
MLVSTDETRIVGGTKRELIYSFVIEGSGSFKLNITGRIEVDCS